MTGEFLSAGELQTLTNCSSSRRSAQIEWLQREGIPANRAIAARQPITDGAALQKRRGETANCAVTFRRTVA